MNSKKKKTVLEQLKTRYKKTGGSMDVMHSQQTHNVVRTFPSWRRSDVRKTLCVRRGTLLLDDGPSLRLNDSSILNPYQMLVPDYLYLWSNPPIPRNLASGFLKHWLSDCHFVLKCLCSPSLHACPHFKQLHFQHHWSNVNLIWLKKLLI